jgi:hypothetical protein
MGSSDVADSGAVPRLGRLRTQAGVAGAIAGFTVVISTFLPGSPFISEGVVIPLAFLLIFPLFGSVVIQGVRRQSKLRWKASTNADYNRAWNRTITRLRRTPKPLLVGIPVLVLGMWFVGIISIASSQGQPVHDGNSYYLDDHGSHIPVTRAGYDTAVDRDERGWGAWATIFLVLASLGSSEMANPASSDGA